MSNSDAELCANDRERNGVIAARPSDKQLPIAGEERVVCDNRRRKLRRVSQRISCRGRNHPADGNGGERTCLKRGRTAGVRVYTQRAQKLLAFTETARIFCRR